jgi:signal peptidase I
VSRRLRAAALVLVAVLVALLVAVHGGAVRLVSVESSSMAPTLCPGDRLVMWGWAASAVARRGSLVVFPRPGTSELVVKRVVAVAGETVEVADGRLLVDGLPVEEAHLDLATVDGTFYGPVRIGPGEVFVMGDAREFSVDSRDFGALPRSALTGVAVRVPGAAARSCQR